jgi:ketosteroid isomerase-like protein
MTAVDEYLAAMGEQDWPRLAATIAEDGLVRDGPFADVIEGKEPYVAFLRGIISTLPGYQLRLRRISQCGDHRFFAELSEVFDIDGRPTEHPEVCLFETDEAGQIRFVSVFMKTPGREGPVAGASAAS